MNVLYLTPNGVGGMSPQITMADFLRPRFNKLDLFVPGRDSAFPNYNKWDVVFSAMESTAMLGLDVSKKLNIPFYSHWEWIPPYRIYGYNGGESPLLWGFRQEHVKSHFKNEKFYRKYKAIIDASIQANVSSCAGVEFKKIAQKFSGNELSKCFIKYPSSPIPLDKNRRRQKENYFITVSRLAVNKRIAEIADAVKIANIDTTWVIVGSGQEQRLIEKKLKGSKTKLKFFHNTNGEKKFDLLSRAKFQLCAWNGLPQLEAALVGTPTINLDIPAVREIYSDTLEYCGDAIAMSEKITSYFASPKLCNSKSDYLYEMAKSNNLNINTLEQGADIIENALKNIL